ncbi:MAG: hypothetical protein WB853_08415, partial [Desulfobacterales bacterium]
SLLLSRMVVICQAAMTLSLVPLQQAASLHSAFLSGKAVFHKIAPRRFYHCILILGLMTA